MDWIEFPTLPAPGRKSWLLVEPRGAEYSLKHPGGQEELVVVIHEPVAFARRHIAQIEWDDSLRSGAIEVQGSRTLARALPTWNRRGWAADDPRRRFDPPPHEPAVKPDKRLSHAGH
jgi:hypothetical protein